MGIPGEWVDPDNRAQHPCPEVYLFLGVMAKRFVTMLGRKDTGLGCLFGSSFGYKQIMLVMA